MRIACQEDTEKNNQINIDVDKNINIHMRNCSKKSEKSLHRDDSIDYDVRVNSLTHAQKDQKIDNIKQTDYHTKQVFSRYYRDLQDHVSSSARSEIVHNLNNKSFESVTDERQTSINSHRLSSLY